MAAVKVLHCVYSMNRGGTESWLMGLIRNVDRSRFRIDILTFSEGPGDFDREIRALGSRVVYCSSFSRPFRLARNLKSIFKRHGPYQVVHSHSPAWNGPVLAVARKMGVPVRIAHCHSNAGVYRSAGPAAYVYSRWSILKSRQCATHGLACSCPAGASYFGRRWIEDPRWRVFYCGLDLSVFTLPVEPGSLRRSLGLPEKAMVVGHVGGFHTLGKNHVFAVRIARELFKIRSDACLLLVGDGRFKQGIEQRVWDSGLAERVVFTGARPDVPQLMLGAMDLFVFPSVSEGLGLAMVEAQAAGLPCVCSDTVPKEADVVPHLVTRLSLSRSPAEWARALVSAWEANQRVTRREAFAVVEKSRFNLERSLGELEAIYLDGQER